jgi:hypothetical protein
MLNQKPIGGLQYLIIIVKEFEEELLWIKLLSRRIKED